LRPAEADGTGKRASQSPIVVRFPGRDSGASEPDEKGPGPCQLLTSTSTKMTRDHRLGNSDFLVFSPRYDDLSAIEERRPGTRPFARHLCPQSLIYHDRLSAHPCALTSKTTTYLPFFHHHRRLVVVTLWSGPTPHRILLTGSISILRFFF